MIDRDRSIIPALDVDMPKCESLVDDTHDIDGIGGYKVGFSPGLRDGLPDVVGSIRDRTDRPVIYDHQKGGTDIPHTGKDFAEICAEADVDGAILFPLTGPETLEEWTGYLRDQGVEVIVGGIMTHDGYLESDGGYIGDDRAGDIYLDAADIGVTDFVVPGNRPREVSFVRKMLIDEGVDPTLYAPGFVAQGGEITEAGKEAGDSWHAIVGRGIFQSESPRSAAREYASQLDFR